ncbi:Hypothetical predicted protein [Pelobates cultripes]|uniref:Uncharacterized protein n=1 Tax=Pelobates cultripes TaxID=61616 RepID=A0AAD1S2G6_PELCU|nr:Hypothetical predicted protein [Pelobates cultripes]
MNTRSTYYQYDESYKLRRRSPSTPRESTSTMTYTAKKNTDNKMKGNQNLDVGERGRARSRHDPDNDRTSDVEKNSDSYYSDDYDNTTYESDQTPTPSFKSRSPRGKKVNPKFRSSTPEQGKGWYSVLFTCEVGSQNKDAGCVIMLSLQVGAK